MLLLWIILVLAFLGFVFRVLIPFRLVSFRDKALISKLPGPKTYPVLGNVAELFTPLHEILSFLLRHTKIYGPRWRLSLIGFECVFLSDPDDLEVLLGSKNYIKKGLSYLFLYSWLGTGLLTSTGKKWNKHRKILTPAFHFKILENYIPIFTNHADILTDKMDAMLGEKYIELNKLVTLCTLDIICETAMGVKINAQQGEHSDYVKAVKRMCQIFNLRNLTPWFYHRWTYSFSNTAREEAQIVKTLHTFTKQVIKEKKAAFEKIKSSKSYEEQMKKSKKPHTFLDTLLEVSEESGFSDKDIREEVDTFMFEGHDTTSAAICWALFLLGGHQDIQDKVFDELNEIFGDSNRTPDFEDLQKMKYLEQVIKEALRLYPSVPALLRLLEMDLKIGDYVIPTGTNIAVIPYVIHRNPDIFPEPEKFNPDHFLPERVNGRHPYAYIPFSAGARNCIGQKFAMLEEKVVLSRVLRRFRVISLDKQEEICCMVEVTLRPRHNLKFKIERRD